LFVLINPPRKHKQKASKKQHKKTTHTKNASKTHAHKTQAIHRISLFQQEPQLATLAGAGCGQRAAATN
jgi:hypothetical protein